MKVKLLRLILPRHRDSNISAFKQLLKSTLFSDDSYIYMSMFVICHQYNDTPLHRCTWIEIKKLACIITVFFVVVVFICTLGYDSRFRRKLSIAINNIRSLDQQQLLSETCLQKVKRRRQEDKESGRINGPQVLLDGDGDVVRRAMVGFKLAVRVSDQFMSKNEMNPQKWFSKLQRG